MNWPWIVAGYALSCVAFAFVAAHISWHRNRRSSPRDYDGRDYEHRDSPHFDDWIWTIAAPMWPGFLALLALIWPFVLAAEWVDRRRERRWNAKRNDRRRT